MVSEMLLPSAIRANTDIRGNAYGWRRADLPAALDASGARGMNNDAFKDIEKLEASL